MISLVLTVLFTFCMLCIFWTLDRLLLPIVAQKLADREWRRLHPDLDRSAWQ